MKLTIKTTLYVLFSSAFLFSQETGRNYAVFNSLIRHTDIEDFYTIIVGTRARNKNQENSSLEKEKTETLTKKDTKRSVAEA